MIKILHVAVLVVFGLSFSGCQKGKKKKSDATTYESSLQNLETLALEIEQMGINLNSSQLMSQVSKNQPPYPSLPKLLQTEQAEFQLQQRLGKFVVAAEKLLVLADSRVVTFPDKKRTLQQLEIAAFYLGDINSRIEWPMDSQDKISKKVDWHELRIRMARVASNMSEIRALGLPDGTADGEKIPKPLKLNQRQKNRAQEIYLVLMRDWMRDKELWNRNNYFDAIGFQKMTELAEVIAGYYMNLHMELRNIKAAR